MDRPPRDPQEPILTRSHWLAIVGYSSVITASVLGALALAVNWQQMEQARAVTVSFLTLAFAQLWHVFNMRGSDSNFLRNDITQNPYIWGALALCALLLLVAVYVPGLANLLQVTNPGRAGWALVIGMSLIPYAVGQILKPFNIFHLPN